MAKAKETVWWKYGHEKKISNCFSRKNCSSRKVIKTHCHIEEVENGKFIKRCEKTEQILKDCVGKPTEVMKSAKEYTNEDVTNEKSRWFLPLEPEFKTAQSDIKNFGFPGLRDDIETLYSGEQKNFW